MNQLLANRLLAGVLGAALGAGCCSAEEPSRTGAPGLVISPTATEPQRRAAEAFYRRYSRQYYGNNLQIGAWGGKDALPNDEQLAPIAHITSLSNVDLRSLPITDRGVEHLAGVVNLELLRLAATSSTTRGGMQITGSGLGALGGLKKLRRLQLCHLPLTPEGIAGLARITSLEELQIVEYAVPPWDERVSLPVGGGVDGALLAAMRDLRGVRKLELQTGRPGVDVEAMTDWRLTETLEELKLTGFEITPAGWEALSRFQHLKRLEYRLREPRGEVVDGERKLRWSRITRERIGWNALAAMPRLQSLQLSSITDEAVKGLARCQQLRELSLGGLKLTDACLAEIAKLGDLKSLELRRSSLTGEGARVLSRMKRLKALRLRVCKLTDEGLRQIVESLPENLERLDLSGCYELTPEGAMVLQQVKGRLRLVILPETVCVAGGDESWYNLALRLREAMPQTEIPAEYDVPP